VLRAEEGTDHRQSPGVHQGDGRDVRLRAGPYPERDRAPLSADSKARGGWQTGRL